MVVPFVAALLGVQPIVLSPRAMTLGALLKALSAQTGESYRAIEAMAGRVVLVAGPRESAEALRADLAAATWGKWRSSNAGWTLEEDPKAVAVREQRRLAGRIAQVKAMQAEMAARAKPFDAAAAESLIAALKTYDEVNAKTPNRSYGAMQKAEALIPANLALRRMVARLDPAELAALEPGKVVYSDRPTRLQRPLPSEASEAMRQLTQDQDVWAKAFPDSAAFEEAHRRTGYLSMDPRAYTDPIPPGGLRLFLKIDTFDYGDSLLTGQFVDPSGKVLQFGETHLDFRDASNRDDPAPKVDPKAPKLELSPEAQALSADRRGGKPTPALRALLLQPERRDPLDLLVAEGLRGVAKARNATVVAWLGDETLNYTVGKGESADEWLHGLWSMNYEVAATAGHVLIRPRFAAVNVSRSALGALLRVTDAKGYVPLDDYADYAVMTPTKAQNGDFTSGVALDVVLPGAVQAARTDWRMLTLWGGFSPAQRQSLLTSRTVPWDAIPSAQRDRFVDAILNAQQWEIRSQGSGSSGMTIANEPTELLAKGFAFGEGVRGRGFTQAGLFAPSQTENPWEGGSTTADGLAQAVFARERDPKEEHHDGLPKTLPAVYVPGRIVHFGFTVALSQTLTWQKQSDFGEFDLRANPTTIEAMPTEFRDTYGKVLESLRKHSTAP